MAVIGIDLGTTNSLGAYWKDGRVQLIPMEGESFLLPSVVGYVEGEGFLAGAAAKELTVGGRVCRAVLNEERLFEICMPLFGKIKQLFLRILEDADSRVSGIDDLIMVGGSSKLGVVKRFLRELLGKEPIVLGETDKVVAYGAGVYAGIR